MTTPETIAKAARVLRPHLSAAARSAIQQVRDAAQALADAGLLADRDLIARLRNDISFQKQLRRDTEADIANEELTNTVGRPNDALATIQRVRSALRCMERFRDELPARSGYGEGSRQAYINCAKWLRTALDQEAKS